MLLIASRAGAQMGPTPVVQSYDLRAARWTDEPNLLFGREGFASCVTDDGRVYVTGGVGGGSRTLDSVEVFTP